MATKNFPKSVEVKLHGIRPSFKVALELCAQSYKVDPEDDAHLRRWRDDDRAEQVWVEIRSAVEKRHLIFPAGFFIVQTLASRQVAICIGRRGEWRQEFRKEADRMERSAKFLRRQIPIGGFYILRKKNLLGCSMMLLVVFAAKSNCQEICLVI
jgi:hypothetical protein